MNRGEGELGAGEKDDKRQSLSGDRFGPVRKPLEMQIARRSDQEAQRFPQNWEMVLQGYSIPLADFADATPGFDPTTLRVIRLVFDLTEAGEVVVDDLGFSWPDPAFLGARVSGPELR